MLAAAAIKSELDDIETKAASEASAAAVCNKERYEVLEARVAEQQGRAAAATAANAALWKQFDALCVQLMRERATSRLTNRRYEQLMEQLSTLQTEADGTKAKLSSVSSELASMAQRHADRKKLSQEKEGREKAEASLAAAQDKTTALNEKIATLERYLRLPSPFWQLSRRSSLPPTQRW
jgi:chromosome segregation ATPase